MPPSSSKLEVGQVIEIDKADRWQVYRRLQELSIQSQCRTNQPLTAQIDDVTAAIQLWSVVRQFRASRHQLASWLEGCWQLRSH